MPRLAAHCDGATGLERLAGAKAAELVPGQGPNCHLRSWWPLAATFQKGHPMTEITRAPFAQRISQIVPHAQAIYLAGQAGRARGEGGVGRRCPREARITRGLREDARQG